MYTGYQMSELVRKLLQEDSGSGFLDSQLTYQLLNTAAKKTATKTKCFTGEQTITTIAEQSAYDLEPDFLELYLRDSSGYDLVKLYDGTSTVFPTRAVREDIFQANNTTSVALPTRFYVKDKAIGDNVTGTATGDGAATAGACTLTASASTFSTSGVKAGDTIYNTVDGSNGVVLSVTSETALSTALFGGTNNDWSTNDTFVIVPQGRYQIVFDPPFSTAGYTVTIPYVKKPAPVYSNYGYFPFPNEEFSVALCYLAAWLYKYRDGEPNFGNAWYQFWAAEIGANSGATRAATKRGRFKVNFKKRS